MAKLNCTLLKSILSLASYRLEVKWPRRSGAWCAARMSLSALAPAEGKSGEPNTEQENACGRRHGSINIVDRP